MPVLDLYEPFCIGAEKRQSLASTANAIGTLQASVPEQFSSEGNVTGTALANELVTGDYSNLSCADLAIVNEQGLSINHAVASAAATLLMKMLVMRDLQYHCVYLSTDVGMFFIHNSPKIIKSDLKP